MESRWEVRVRGRHSGAWRGTLREFNQI
jgi:hypothetical protein